MGSDWQTRRVGWHVKTLCPGILAALKARTAPIVAIVVIAISNIFIIILL